MNNAQYIDMLRTSAMQARLALALYRGQKSTKNVAEAAGGTMHWFEVAHVRAAAIVFHDHIHITVCGSNDRPDWNDNIAASHIKDLGLTTHRGYTLASHRLLTEIQRRGLFRPLSNRPLVLGGHSAGGAIAQLLALSLSPREVITFGCPRVFEPQSATSYSAFDWPVRRFVCSGDPIPHFPLRKFRCLFGRAQYAHSSAALHLSDNGSVLMEQEAGTIRKAADLAVSAMTASVAQVAKWLYAMPVLMKTNHSMSRYSAAIHKAVERVGG